MPMTLAHPAAVLPLARCGLPMSAMVAGSMVADIPLFVRPGGLYDVTHSWLGVVLVDPVLCMLVLAVWFGVVRDPMVDVMPARLRGRFVPTTTVTRRQFWLAYPAAALGASTHVGWDLFTHGGRWGVRKIGWLQSTHFGLPGFKWAQYLSGIIGLVVVFVALLRWLRRQSPIATPNRVPRLGSRALLVALVFAAVPTGIVLIDSVTDGLHAVAFNTVVTGITATACAICALSLVWQAVVRWPVESFGA
jgi:putative effector of murein hydrolase LrgA (UPF0299 family)